MPGRMLYVHALSPIQNGIGRGSGVIDLPIARESTTGWPAIYGSALKGVLRDACAELTDGDDQDGQGQLKDVFGPGVDDDPSSQAGGVVFTDARLLCFPVRSLAGSFARLTSPMALRRWRRDHKLISATAPTFDVEPADGNDPEILLGPNSPLVMSGGGPARVFLEDLDLQANTHQAQAVDALAAAIATRCFPDDEEWQMVFRARFGIVPDSVFDFLTETATDVSARVRIDDARKTVADGGLWYEEAIPAEAILAAPLLALSHAAKNGGVERLLETVANGMGAPLQIGGNASVGRGLVELRLAPNV